MRDDTERCRVCVLPRSTNLVEFDDDGICMLCRSMGAGDPPPQDAALAESQVESIVEQIRRRGEGRDFDCVVGLSGGRDSSYLLYLLVRKHRLRCLAAYYRTPFTPDIIDANVRRMTSRLNVPLVEMDVSQEYHQRVARELVLLWTRDPHPIIPNLACAPCKLLNRELYRVAASRGIRSIVAGANTFEAVQISAGQPNDTTVVPGREASKRQSLWTQTKKMLLVAKRGIDVLRTSSSLWRYLPLAVKASILYISPHTPFLRLVYPRIRAIEYFYHANWDEAHSQQALEEIGWELPPGFTSTWKADCTFAELKNAMFQQMMGLTYMDAFYSNMVRAGVISREEAIARLETEGQPSVERLTHAIDVLGVQDTSVAAFVNEPCSE